MLKASSIDRSVDFIRHRVNLQDRGDRLLDLGVSMTGDEVSLQGDRDRLHGDRVNFHRFSVGLQGRSLMSLSVIARGDG